MEYLKRKKQKTHPSNDTHNPCSRPCHGRVDVQNTTVGWLCSDRRELAYHAEPPIQHTATDLHASCCPVRPPGGVVGGQIGKLRLFLGTISRGSVHYRTKLMVVILIRSIPWDGEGGICLFEIFFPRGNMDFKQSISTMHWKLSELKWQTEYSKHQRALHAVI